MEASCQLHAPAPLTSRKEPTLWIDGWVGSIERCSEDKNPVVPEIKEFES